MNSTFPPQFFMSYIWHHTCSKARITNPEAYRDGEWQMDYTSWKGGTCGEMEEVTLAPSS
jgi:hypothetical protein